MAWEMKRQQHWDRVKERSAREGRLETKEHYLGGRHRKGEQKCRVANNLGGNWQQWLPTLRRGCQ